MQRRKELEAVTTIQTIKCDTGITVGEALAVIIKAWKEIPKSGQVKIMYNRKTPGPKTTRHSTSLSYLFDVDFASRKSFYNSLLMKQLTVDDVEYIKIVSIRGFRCIRIVLSPRDSLYDYTDLNKKDMMVELYGGITHEYTRK